jgi:hypothetical protein
MCLTQIKHAQIKINLLSFWTVHPFADIAPHFPLQLLTR